jgi:hypothetical protein
MSLTKALLQPTGFTVEYWRVANISLDPINQEMNVAIHGYKDKSAFDLGVTPAVNQSFTLDHDSFLALTTPGVVAAAKDWLKIVDDIVAESIPDLSDATQDDNDVI